MASPGNRHCADCIGALSFPIILLNHKIVYIYIGVSYQFRSPLKRHISCDFWNKSKI